MNKKTNGLQWNAKETTDHEDFECKPQYRTYKDLVEWLIENDNYSHDMLEEKLKFSGIDIKTLDLSVPANVDDIREVFANHGELFTCSIARFTADIQCAQMRFTTIEIKRNDIKEALDVAIENVLSKKHTENDIKDSLDAAIEDVLTEIYKKYDVKTGDIDPFQALALDEYIEQIARHEQIAEHTEQIVDLYIELIKMNCNNLVKII